MEDNYLIHYGILGMKWGIRRYQNKDGTLTKDGINRYRNSQKDASRSKSLRQDKNNRNSYPVEKYQGMQRENKLMRNSVTEQKARELIEKYGSQPTGTIASFSMVTSGASNLADKLYQIKKTNEQLNELNSNKKYDSFSDIPKNKSKNVEDYIKDINPNFKDKEDAGSKMNCVLCTTALVLREKGYKANASSSTLGFYPKEFFNKTFKGAEYKDIKAKNSTQFLESFEKLGDGAYGHLSVKWKNGGKHSLFFKNENSLTKIYDGQSGKEIDYRKENNNFFQAIQIGKSHYIRLDQAEPGEKVLGAIR